MAQKLSNAQLNWDKNMKNHQFEAAHEKEPRPQAVPKVTVGDEP